MLRLKGYPKNLLSFVLKDVKERNFSSGRKKVYDCVVKEENLQLFPNLIRFLAFLQRKSLTWNEIKVWYEWKEIEAMRKDQKFLPARHKSLGPDLAAAHFFVFRGAKIRFKGSNTWLTKENVKTKEIPSTYIESFHLEGIDASGTNLCYEGFDNLVFVMSLKELLLKDCPFIDDFCLHRMHLVGRSLEHLDISGCSNVTERGICTLHQLRKLKKLVIHDTNRIMHKELVCLLLQDIIPECKIEGVDYSDPILLRRLKKYL